MKKLVIDNKYAAALLDFLNNEVINGTKEIEGVIMYDNSFINEDNICLNECFQELNKTYSINQINDNLSIWFPYGLLISASGFSYEVIKKYTLYLSRKYNIVDKELFFNPHLFFQSNIDGHILDDITIFFDNYKRKNQFLKNIQTTLENKDTVSIELDEEKFLNSKLITNINEKNKDFLEFLLDCGVFNGNSFIEYAGKNIALLEFLLLRSLTCSQQLIIKMMLQINKKNLTQIKININNLDLSYLQNFKEQLENFTENMHLIDKKMILLKFEEDERSSSGSSSKGVVKI